MEGAIAGIVVLCQCFVAWFTVSVWTWRFKMETGFRAMGTTSIPGEFAAYGYPSWFWKVVMVLKLASALALVIGILMPEVAMAGAIGIVVLMTGAVVSHVKVADPPSRSLASGTMLVLSAFVAYAVQTGLAEVVEPTLDPPACFATALARQALTAFMVVVGGVMIARAAMDGTYTSISPEPLLG
jgi:hypothetical protein